MASMDLSILHSRCALRTSDQFLGIVLSQSSDQSNIFLGFDELIAKLGGSLGTVFKILNQLERLQRMRRGSRCRPGLT